MFWFFFSLTEGLDHLIRSIDVFVGSNDIGNDREKSELACKMKMIVYLLCQLVELIEADVLQKVSFFSVRPKSLFWFRSNTETETQMADNFDRYRNRY